MHLTVRFSRRTIPRCKPGQSGNLLTVECTKFRQICYKHSAGLRAYSGYTLEDMVFVFKIDISIDIVPDKPVDFIYLAIKNLDHFLNTLFNLWMAHRSQTIRLPGSQVIKLSASSYKFGQFFDLGLRMWFRDRFDNLCELGQDLCIDGISLCLLPHTFGEITNLPRINYRNRQRITDQFGYKRAFITTFRRKILNLGVREYLETKLRELRKYYPDWEYIEIGIKKDHVHLYMVIPPKYAVSKVVETIKSNTSKALRIKFAFLKKVYWDDKGIWAKGYFVSTVGINEKIIKEYVKKQEKEDTGQAKLEF